MRTSEHVPRPSLLAIVEHTDQHVLGGLRRDLDAWHVVACVADDVPSALRAFRFALVLVVGDIRIAPATWAALEGGVLKPQCVAYATTPELSAAAVERAVTTLRVTVPRRSHR